MQNNEHILKLCLPPELHSAIIKFQAKHDLGRPYAGLLLLTKALYQEQLITREAYETFTYRYSRKLVREELPQIEKPRQVVASQVDYATYTLQQLEQAYQRAYTLDDYTKRNLILGELKRRGIDIQRFQHQIHR